MALSLLALDPDDKIHNFLPGQKGISHCEEIDPEEGILGHTHNRGVPFGGNDLLGHMGDVFEFGCGLVRLRHVHIHLVAIEIGIVGCADGQIESEGVVGQNADSVAHHTHSVKGGLPIEQNVVAILKGSFNNSAIGYKFLYLLGPIVYFDEVDNLFLLSFVF